MAAAGMRVQMCVTSPPYWGLRDYGIESNVWGGRLDCEHVWGDEISVHKGGPSGETTGLTNRGANQARNRISDIRAGQFCQCGAWLGTLGLEPDYRMYVEHIVEVMDLVRQVLADDGTLWLNMGDSYHSGDRGGWRGDNHRWDKSPMQSRVTGSHMDAVSPNRLPQVGLKDKDLCLMPARVAIALQEAGWWVRQDIIWSKPNPMPESVTDRCTKSHEYIFLLSKAARYYYDAEAIKEPAEGPPPKMPDGWDTTVGEGGHGSIHKRGRDKGKKTRDLGPKLQGERDDLRTGRSLGGARMGRGAGWRDDPDTTPDKRNKRSVWTISTQPYSEAHFATFPPKLIEPCILAGSRKGDVVLDPFLGSGTTAQVAEHLGRQWIGCEMDPDCLVMQRDRLRQQSLEL